MGPRTAIATVHRCQECGATTPKWAGRCPGCGEWNVLVEERVGVGVRPHRADGPAAGIGVERAEPIGEVSLTGWSTRSTGLAEVDRVLGGGLVPGSVTVIGGEPGIGKSTLLLQVAAAMARAGARCLVVSAEESKPQVRLRAERLGAVDPGVLVLADTSLAAVLDAVEEVSPDFLVVDSIQTLYDDSLGSAPGSVAQVRECAHQLVQVAKARGMATVLVGHVTKEGALAGPRVLEHIVDTVLSFDGERHHALRLLRAVKHRFGATGELGLFEMGESGLVAVPDPSRLFLGDRREGASGSAVVAAMEGDRPLLVEVQSLIVSSTLTFPRRESQGIDGGRLALVLAVLEGHAGCEFTKRDVFASAVGGVRLHEPGADLGLALAIVSALTLTALPAGIVAIGEVGLTGEVRSVAHAARRLAEARRLGFTTAVVPASAPDAPAGMRVHRVTTVAEALDAAGASASEPG